MDISQPDDLYKEEETVRQPSLMPRDPLEVFNWIASLDVDKLEDETPPASFYFDLVETKDVELACSVNTGKLLVTLGCQTDVSQPDYSSNAALAPTDLKLSIPEESESEPKPHENSERPPSRFSFFGMLVKAVLALSVVHALYVLSTIGFETFKNRVCQSSVLNMTPPQTSSIRETIASLPESIWRSVEAKIASLRARFR
ncbi:uncharacterized protein Dsimw501_GD16386, isoform B [Drosophila simulans]|nr:uncharacterized protein Dsimw501_GD16386, isoform B [Drosophila simulans]